MGSEAHEEEATTRGERLRAIEKPCGCTWAEKGAAAGAERRPSNRNEYGRRVGVPNLIYADKQNLVLLSL